MKMKNTKNKKDSITLKYFSISFIIFLLLSSLLSSVLYAEELIDKKGRVVHEVTKRFYIGCHKICPKRGCGFDKKEV